MMGVSLAPGSGKTVSQIIENGIEVNSMFDPERFNA
jgi:hypothetical protein